MTVRYIEENGKRFAVIPVETYDRMLDDLDDLDDIRAYDCASAEKQEFYPIEIVRRLIERENRVKVFREWRGLTQKALAERTGLAPLYISQIECGNRQGSIETLKTIAGALDISIDMLID
jgi:DNA-binding XRE family transcriptional regulator